MTFICPPEFLAIAHELGELARPVALHYFRSAGLNIERKGDATPVTIADGEIEDLMRGYLAKMRPQDGVFGEEQGRTNAEAEYQWILDPIDGTQFFSAGFTNFGVLIALHHRDHGVVLGLCDMPASDDRWWSVKGGAVYMNGKPVTTRKTTDLKDAIVACTDPLRLPSSVLKTLQDLRGQVRFSVYGGNCTNYALLASGFIDVIIEGKQQFYDIAPFVPMIEQAGGVITQLTGAPIGIDNTDDLFLCASTPELHKQILEKLRA